MHAICLVHASCPSWCIRCMYVTLHHCNSLQYNHQCMHTFCPGLCWPDIIIHSCHKIQRLPPYLMVALVYLQLKVTCDYFMCNRIRETKQLTRQTLKLKLTLLFEAYKLFDVHVWTQASGHFCNQTECLELREYIIPVHEDFAYSP